MVTPFLVEIVRVVRVIGDRTRLVRTIDPFCSRGIQNEGSSPFIPCNPGVQNLVVWGCNADGKPNVGKALIQETAIEPDSQILTVAAAALFRFLWKLPMVLLYSGIEQSLLSESEAPGHFEIPLNPALLHGETGTAQFSVGFPNRGDIGFNSPVFDVVRGSKRLKAQTIEALSPRRNRENHQRKDESEDKRSVHTFGLPRGRRLSNRCARPVVLFNFLG
jgi:hypothetical protein